MSKYKIASKKTSDLLFPNVRPTLDLNFVENQKVPPFVNVTRNSQTTYVDKFGILRTADINQPIFEWDPITGKCLGARIWGAVTNLLLRSEELETTAWGRIDGASVTANQSTGPTGSLTLDRVFGNGSQIGFLFQNFLITLGTAYTFSIFLKKSNSSQVLTLFYGLDFNSGGANPQAIWNLDTGVATFSNNCSGGMILYPNNIYRCYITVTATRTAITSAQFLRMSSLSGDVFAGGAQLQTGSTLGPYVPTTTTAASSTADVWSITGEDFSRIWNQSAATMYAEATRDVVPAGDFPSVCGAYGTAFSDRIAIRYLIESLASFEVYAANIEQFTCFPTVTTRTRQFAAASETDNFAASFNGAAPLIDTSGTNPTVSRMFIGSNPNGQFLNGYIRRLTIYPKRLTDTQLQTLTR